MIHQDAKIVMNPIAPFTPCTVKSRTRLADCVHNNRNSPHSYLLVEDEQGTPVGVVALDDLRTRLNSPNLSERRRWQNMPVEAALNGRLCLPAALAVNSGHHVQLGFQQIQNCSALSQNSRLVALVTPDDLLISWRSVEQLVRQSQSDHVTGLPMRASFDTDLRAKCVRASSSDHSVAVLLIDIDHFKEINDCFGHAAGDAVLSAIGGTLRSTFRSYDTVCRYGGDEFAVLCCGCLPGEINSTIELLRHGMEKLQAVASIPRPVPTVSVGACVVHDLNLIDCPDQILKAADECLYLAKREGRDRSYFTEIGLESAIVC